MKASKMASPPGREGITESAKGSSPSSSVQKQSCSRIEGSGRLQGGRRKVPLPVQAGKSSSPLPAPLGKNYRWQASLAKTAAPSSSQVVGMAGRQEGRQESSSHVKALPYSGRPKRRTERREGQGWGNRFPLPLPNGRKKEIRR